MSKVDQVQITSEVLKQEVIETPTLKEINLWVFLVFFFLRKECDSGFLFTNTIHWTGNYLILGRCGFLQYLHL